MLRKNQPEYQGLRIFPFSPREAAALPAFASISGQPTAAQSSLAPACPTALPAPVARKPLLEAADGVKGDENCWGALCAGREIGPQGAST